MPAQVRRHLPARRLRRRPVRRQVARHRLPLLRRAARHRAVRLARPPDVRPPDVLRRLLRRSQLFTYEFEQHIPEIQQVRPPLHRQARRHRRRRLLPHHLPPPRRRRQPDGAWPATACATCASSTCSTSCSSLDGTLTPARYKALVVVQADVVEQPVLDKLEAYVEGRRPGHHARPAAVAKRRGRSNLPSQTPRSTITGMRPDGQWLRELAAELTGVRGVDGAIDGLWTCRRGDEVFVFNATDKPVKTVDSTVPRSRSRRGRSG